MTSWSLHLMETAAQAIANNKPANRAAIPDKSFVS